MYEIKGEYIMKVCLINPPVQMNRRLFYPIGICYVAAALLEKGHEVEIIDIIGENLTRSEFEKRIKKSKATFFGIGGLIMAFNNVVDIAQIIRKHHPLALIFAGNTIGSTIPEILLKNSEVGVIVFGEGEITTCDLVDNKTTHLKDVKGIAYINKTGSIEYTTRRIPIEDLDKIPFPAWHLIPLNNYFKEYGKNVYPISSVRGCPYNCIFCCKTFIGYKVRSRSPKSILNELITVKELYNIKSFVFFDDLFLYNKQRAIEFCKLKTDSELKNMEWIASARVDSITDELVKILKEAKCCELGIGFESASQEILDYYKKGITVEQSQKAVDICKKYDMSLNGASFMIGAPDESIESITASRTFCRTNDLRYEPHFLTPYPKTALYKSAITAGLILDELEYIKKISKYGNTNYLTLNLTKNFSDKELIELKNKMIYIPFSHPKNINYYILEGIEILKHQGVKSFISKIIKFTPTIIRQQISPLKHQQREVYSNEWK